jgi:aryl-alcohol dehydrogenase-like predicted oxidoreductase
MGPWSKYVREAAEASLAKLGVESIDLFYLHVRFHSFLEHNLVLGGLTSPE